MEDIIVVGAGPAGSRVAAALAQKGHRVKVLEEHGRAGEAVCCTGIVGSECYADLGGEASVLRSARSVTFVSPSGHIVRLEKDSPQAYVLDRPSLDIMLAEKAASYGADFVYDCHVEKAARTNSHIEVRTVRRGRAEVHAARGLVLASGPSSRLTSSLGLGELGDFAVGAQTEIEVEGIAEVEVRFSNELAPGFFTWVVPTTGKRALVGMICREKPRSHFKAFLSRLEREGRIKSTECMVQARKIPLRPLDRTYGDHIVAVGDAAGQVKPTTGGGIYYGLLCADAAADVLDRALRAGDLSKRMLSTYESRWRKTLGSELRMGYLCRMAFERLGDRTIDALFEAVQANSIDRIALNSRAFSFDWHGGILGRAINHPAIWKLLGTTVLGLLSGKGGNPLAAECLVTVKGRSRAEPLTPPSDCAMQS